MLVTFLIMLREGVEAALIVGIVASFLKQGGHSKLINRVWLGVILAVLLCLAVGWVMFTGTDALPKKQQGILAGTIALLAVAMLTYMTLWMKRAAGAMKTHLQASVSSALHYGKGQGWALVGMAFLAVVREGIETVFFLLAIAQQNHTKNMLIGAALGLAVAIVIGWLIYEGGVRINLAKFFRWTGVFLIFVSAGLFAGAFRAFHNAGLWNLWQTPLTDLSGILSEKSALGSIISGIFGYKDHPTQSDLIFYLLYLIPVLMFFLKNKKKPGARISVQ
ncbi:iron uptake transporter permease EfeU [Suttonella ornithocola]|uniref:Ferrous iron uptake protein n=1 Tax=Suttonella ornithocola TaxID=279832 RepID=A0A380MUI3_9GAMM|nr:iron uptake transporter permease EfeU [Suttonella ornithocola]SUO96260.1 Ferrous iron uptake protein [Suttonella ornithocola]